MIKTKIILICVVLLFCFGCGHNIVSTDKGIGVNFKIPLPNGGSVIDLKMGYIDSTSSVVRGNTTVDASTASGGSAIGMGGGTSQVVLIKTGPQLNQGYLANILTDKNVDPQTKQIIAKYLVQSKQLKLKPTSLTVEKGGVTTGTNPKEARSVKEGLDNVVEKVSDSYKASLDETTSKARSALDDMTNIVMKHITLISTFFLIILFLIVIIVLILKHKNKVKNV